MGLSQVIPKAKRLMIRTAGPLGLYAGAWGLTQDRPRIFMYHRFASVDKGAIPGRETFRSQVRLLKKYCQIVDMKTLAEKLRDEPKGAARLAVITVDDGYRDFYEHALPVLQEENVPATFYPVTGFLDGELWLWPDLVEHALDIVGRTTLSAKSIGLGSNSEWPVTDTAERRAAWQAIINHAIDLKDEDKWSFLRQLYSQLGIQWPSAIPDHYAPVTWSQLAEIADAGIEIGAHTRTHCRLTRVNDSNLVAELSGARQRLEEEIDRPIVSLCYPNGAPADYDARVINAAEEAGYRSAVVAYFDGNAGGLYELRRHGVTPDMDQFRRHLCGIEDISWRLRRAE